MVLFLDVLETDSKVSTALTAMLHGLKPFTNYSIQILAFTRIGDGIPSIPIFCITDEAGTYTLILKCILNRLNTWILVLDDDKITFCQKVN